VDRTGLGRLDAKSPTVNTLNTRRRPGSDAPCSPSGSVFPVLATNFAWPYRAAVFTILLLLPWLAQAHLGSPDVFFDGMAGPYPARIVIRMPAVVPGRAEISVRVQQPGQATRPPGLDGGTTPTIEESRPTVSFLSLYSRTAITNAPPPDVAQLASGESNLYTGELWLMSFGAYSIEVRIRGTAGDGVVQIPVNSVALRQLPLPPYLGKVLVVLGIILLLGAIGIAAAAAREAVLPAGLSVDASQRRKGWRVGALTSVILVILLAGGKRWWQAEEKAFRNHLRAGAWPDLAAEVRLQGPQRILRLTLGQKEFGQARPLSLLPDHGKLIHLFLVRQPNHDAFGHLHPVRVGDQAFEVALPPLPQGQYEAFCDVTLADSAMSSTATAMVQIPAAATNALETSALQSDPDDSWAANLRGAEPAQVTGVPTGTPSALIGDILCRMPGGEQIVWKAHAPLRARQDAALSFEVRERDGQPLELEPYMGMLSHAAVLRADGFVFAHLHPSGNYSMAAQSFFDTKLQRETAIESGGATPAMAAGMDHSTMHHHHVVPASAVISLPYEFPSPGDYRIWAQFKSHGKVLTAAFDATVAAK